MLGLGFWLPALGGWTGLLCLPLASLWVIRHQDLLELKGQLSRFAHYLVLRCPSLHILLRLSLVIFQELLVNRYGGVVLVMALLDVHDEEDHEVLAADLVFLGGAECEPCPTSGSQANKADQAEKPGGCLLHLPCRGMHLPVEVVDTPMLPIPTCTAPVLPSKCAPPPLRTAYSATRRVGSPERGGGGNPTAN